MTDILWALYSLDKKIRKIIFPTVPEFILSTCLGLLHDKNTNLELSFETQFSKKNAFVQINQDFIVYVKKKTSCLSLSINIFSHLTYKIKDKINSQIAFPQRLKKYSRTYAV